MLPLVCVEQLKSSRRLTLIEMVVPTSRDAPLQPYLPALLFNSTVRYMCASASPVCLSNNIQSRIGKRKLSRKRNDPFDLRSSAAAFFTSTATCISLGSRLTTEKQPQINTDGNDRSQFKRRSSLALPTCSVTQQHSVHVQCLIGVLLNLISRHVPGSRRLSQKRNDPFDPRSSAAAFLVPSSALIRRRFATSARTKTPVPPAE
jgi:hypothetical protein